MKEKYKRLSAKKWAAMVKAGKVEDLSKEMPAEFLMVGQWMRAKVRIDGEIYLASGWAGLEGGTLPYVILTPATPLNPT